MPSQIQIESKMDGNLEVTESITKWSHYGSKNKQSFK